MKEEVLHFANRIKTNFDEFFRLNGKKFWIVKQIQESWVVYLS